MLCCARGWGICIRLIAGVSPCQEARSWGDGEQNSAVIEVSTGCCGAQRRGPGLGLGDSGKPPWRRCFLSWVIRDKNGFAKARGLGERLDTRTDLCECRERPGRE